jgi:hypothetical protein
MKKRKREKEKKRKREKEKKRKREKEKKRNGESVGAQKRILVVSSLRDREQLQGKGNYVPGAALRKF